MFQLWIPPIGKPDKKAVLSACCGDETTTCHDRAFADGLYDWRYVIGYSFGTSKNEASAVSLAQPLENPQLMNFIEHLF